MFCMNCGKQIRDGSLFCPYCGQRTTVPTIMDSDAGQHVRSLPEAGGMPLYEQSVERNQSQTEKKQSLWNKSRGFRWRILLVVGIAFAILVFVVESFSMLSPEQQKALNLVKGITDTKYNTGVTLGTAVEELVEMMNESFRKHGMACDLEWKVYEYEGEDELIPVVMDIVLMGETESIEFCVNPKTEIVFVNRVCEPNEIVYDRAQEGNLDYAYEEYFCRYALDVQQRDPAEVYAVE